MVAAFKAKLNEDDDDVEELVESSMPDDEQEFLDCEMEHDIEFSTFNRMNLGVYECSCVCYGALTIIDFVHNNCSNR